MRAAVLFAQECWAKQSGSSWGVVTTFCHMSNVKQPSFLPNLKVLWIFQCLLNPCLRFWASFVCELVFRASLPSRACSVVCRTRVERVTLSRDKLGTRNWRVPFARLWARSLLRRAAQKKKARSLAHLLVLCDVDCCAKGDLAKTSWAVHRAHVFIAQVPFLLSPLSLFVPFGKTGSAI